MAFNDFREPIEYVVDQYFQRKKYLSNNLKPECVEISSSAYMDESLPEYPVTFIRDTEGLVTKIIYGDTKELEKIINEGLEGCPIIWQEAFIRDSGGLVTDIDKTYPDGVIVRTTFKRENGVVVSIEVGDSL